eukprot:gnl/MRDRNA2_/MRDRNA2_88472_c0_seq1.p1 gnl/MRDRNA2_/MRDRNA2_88472_c0~~gnl/MRDRNA2_/MRDRNA2_88472_c0_seq1.p1  ORF type:complete len:314 (+),score=65.54 gnl/MRDRNA2_/MRDRNA2_88472_c0_seq1:112-942(+)
MAVARVDAECFDEASCCSGSPQPASEVMARRVAESLVAAGAELSLANLGRLAGQTTCKLMHEMPDIFDKASAQVLARKVCHELLIDNGLTARAVDFFSNSKCTDDLEIGENRWRQILSNFHMLSTPLQCWGRSYPSVEHGYQAAKFLRLAVPKSDAQAAAMDFEVAGILKKGLDAKMAGARKGMMNYGCEMDCEAWESKHQEEVMQCLLRARWDVDPQFRRILSETARQNIHLVHFERSGKSSYWGGCIKNGEVLGTNKLGKMLMALRDEKSSTDA